MNLKRIKEKRRKKKMDIEIHLNGSIEEIWTRIPEVLNAAEKKTREYPNAKVIITCGHRN